MREVRCKGVRFNPLISHRCVLGETKNRPINVPSLIHFKSQVCIDKVHCYLGGGDNLSQK